MYMSMYIILCVKNEGKKLLCSLVGTHVNWWLSGMDKSYTDNYFLCVNNDGKKLRKSGGSERH